MPQKQAGSFLEQLSDRVSDKVYPYTQEGPWGHERTMKKLSKNLANQRKMIKMDRRRQLFTSFDIYATDNTGGGGTGGISRTLQNDARKAKQVLYQT